MTAPWSTIPRLIDDAAERFAEVEAIADGESAGPSPSSEPRSIAPRRPDGVGHRGRRPGRIVGAELLGWATAALGVHVAGGIVVPINTRFKGARRPM